MLTIIIGVTPLSLAVLLALETGATALSYDKGRVSVTCHR